MIRLCAHSFGCLNLVGWVYKWEYVPNLRWFLVMWTMNISLSNLISTWTNGDATMTAFHQSRAGNMQWRAWQFFSFIIFCNFASVFLPGSTFNQCKDAAHSFNTICCCLWNRTDLMGHDAVFTTLHVVVLVTGQWKRYCHSFKQD